MSTTTHSKPIHLVAVYYVDEDSKFSLLLGLKKKGYGKGKVMPPGGHVDREDEGDVIRTARREGHEETGLIGSEGTIVAKLKVFIRRDQTNILVDIVTFKSWSGRAKANSEFEWLRFIPFLEIPWNQMLPGEREWMTEVLYEKRCAIVRLECGKDREDLVGSPVMTALLVQPRC